jgi:hypothetical protein
MRLKNAILSRLFAQKQTDLRSYPRFALVHDRIGFVFLSGHPLGRIRELSYGGFSVEIDPNQESLLANATEEKRITLQLLDGRLDCLAVQRSGNDRFIGFAFQHETLKTYEFLNRYLPFMKFGAALRYLIHNDQKDSKKLPPLLANDEEVRASLDIDGYDDHQIPLATIEMGENGFFYKLTREANRVQTWHSIGPGGVGGSLRSTPTVDPIVLRKALSFLVGYAGADYQIPVGRLIQNLLDLADTESFLPPYPKPVQARVFSIEPAKRRTKSAAKRNSK